ncbi:MAG: porin, partial [Oxalobacteraceae bacterium]
RYTTPSIGGLTANVYYQLGEQVGGSGKNNVGGNVLYFNGPLSLTVAYHDVEVNNPVDNTASGPSIVKSIPVTATTNVTATEQKLWLIGGAYNFNVVKVFATYDQAKHDVDLRDKTGTLGVSIPTGAAGKILGAVAQTRRTSNAFDERRRTTYSVGYDYSLSKRTELYAFLLNDKVTNFENEQSLALGVRHRF